MTSKRKIGEHYTVESSEGEWAVLEADAETTFPVSRVWLPENVKVGDVLSTEVASGGDEGSLKLAIDAEATTKRREAAEALQATAVGGPEGDIEL